MCYPAGMRGIWKTAIAGFCTIVAVGAQGGTRSGEREAVLERLNRDDLRVGSLGYRLATSNSQRCARQMPGTGLILHSLDQYRGDWRETAVRLFGTIGGVAIEGVVAQSPAALAGFEPGDELIAINGKPLDPASEPANASTLRRDQTEETLASLPPQGPVRITVLRSGQARDLILRPVQACRVRFEVIAGSARVARTDGRIIQLGQELTAPLSDEGIAFVLAHELAHSILDHRTQLALFEQQGRSKVAAKKRLDMAREFEDQADRLSIHLLVQAGFDPWAGPRFMRRLGTGFDKASTGGKIHRPAQARAELMEAEIAGLQAVTAG